MVNRSFFFNYIGGKSKDLKYIMPSVDLTNIKTIVEPFCGSCAFSTHLDKDFNFVFNDIDKNLIDFLNDVKTGHFPKYIEYYNNHFNEYFKDNKPTDKWYNLKRKKDMTLFEYYMLRRLQRMRAMFNLEAKNEVESNYNHLVKLFSKAKLYNGDYKTIIDKYINDKEAFIFIDPPYLDSYNSSYKSYSGNSTDENKVIIDNTQMFIEFVDILKNAKCKVMIIINSNALTKYLYKDFISTSYQKRYDMTGRITEHLIVTNY